MQWVYTEGAQNLAALKIPLRRYVQIAFGRAPNWTDEMTEEAQRMSSFLWSGVEASFATSVKFVVCAPPMTLLEAREAFEGTP
mmetsp:Transcript_10163/g.17905  ORF Transcript_10163/g.17905 Transcript_10163/m.17905 type:complete len:83 (+) Transcript_10163:513-761(+)